MLRVRILWYLIDDSSGSVTKRGRGDTIVIKLYSLPYCFILFQVTIDDTDCIHLHVRGKDKGRLRICGMSFLSLIRYCVRECAIGTKTQTFHPKEPHTQEAGTAVCSPTSIYVIKSSR
jgi:hypothetical protein